MFTDLAEEAARSRLFARVEYPTDYQAVGARVVQYARNDGFATPWTGTIPTGPGSERILLPRWRARGSPGFSLQALSSALVHRRLLTLRRWPPSWSKSGISHAPSKPIRSHFTRRRRTLRLPTYDFVGRKIFEKKLDNNPPRVARAYALMAAAQFDSIVPC
jgi:hypothetical protein